LIGNESLDMVCIQQADNWFYRVLMISARVTHILGKRQTTESINYKYTVVLAIFPDMGTMILYNFV